MALKIAIIDQNNEVVNIIIGEDDYQPSNQYEIILSENAPIPTIGDVYNNDGTFGQRYKPTKQQLFLQWVEMTKVFMNSVLQITQHYTDNDQWILLTDEQKQQLAEYRKALKDITDDMTIDDHVIIWPIVPSFIKDEEKTQIQTLCKGFDNNFTL